MPFFDNTGADTDTSNGPVWDAFTTLRDQLERLVLVNIGWSLQLVPAMLALAFPGWPAALRVALIAYSVVVLAPATGALYAMARCAVEGEPLSPALLRQTLAELAVPSLRTLAPLLGLLGPLVFAVAGLELLRPALGDAVVLIVGVVLRLALLLALTCALYWGPLFAAAPSRSAFATVRRSAVLVWRSPGRTLLVGGVVVIALIIGIVSIGGLFLAVPVLIALLQTHLYLAVSPARERAF